MSVELAELRVEQVAEVVAFARERSGTADAGAVVWSLSLVARSAGEIVAVAIYQQRTGDPVLEVVLDPAVEDPAAMARLLVDKALLKIQARRVHKCSIVLRAEQGESLLFPAATWCGEPEDVADVADDGDAASAAA